MTRDSSRPQPSIDVPRPSVADIQRLAAGELSLPSRIGHVVLLVVSVMMAATIGSLWATEPSLPPRTHAAFAIIVGAALAWAIFALWVLARRRLLFGADRVLAARMGLTFSAVGAVSMGALGYWGELGRGAYLGALVQAALCGVALVLLVRAQRHVAALARRRQELEDQLAGRGPRSSAAPNRASVE
jgi:hypothetical protein